VGTYVTVDGKISIRDLPAPSDVRTDCADGAFLASCSDAQLCQHYLQCTHPCSNKIATFTLYLLVNAFMYSYSNVCASPIHHGRVVVSLIRPWLSGGAMLIVNIGINLHIQVCTCTFLFTVTLRVPPHFGKTMVLFHRVGLAVGLTVGHTRLRLNRCVKLLMA
jgi:hypothetical protein